MVASVGAGGPCSNGGASITSGDVTAYACNGAKGDPAPATPRLVARSATGELIGPVLAPQRDIGTPYLAYGVYVVATGKIAFLDQGTGHAACTLPRLYFESDDCSGPPWAAAGGQPAIGTFCEFRSKLYTLSSPVGATPAISSVLDLGGCSPSSGPGTVYPTTEVTDSRYPYPAPLQIVYE